MSVDSQAGNALEMANVASDQDVSVLDRSCGDEQVWLGEQLSLLAQLPADAREPPSDSTRDRADSKALQKAADRIPGRGVEVGP
jgi:hypothetical protein